MPRTRGRLAALGLLIAGLAGCAPTLAQRLDATPAPSHAIFVTTGPLSQATEALGEVDVDSRGLMDFGAFLTDALFRAPLAVGIQSSPNASMAKIHELLRKRAWEQYGEAVDAVINVTSRVDPSGIVSASGLAVRLVRNPDGTVNTAMPAALAPVALAAPTAVQLRGSGEKFTPPAGMQLRPWAADKITPPADIQLRNAETAFRAGRMSLEEFRQIKQVLNKESQ